MRSSHIGPCRFGPVHLSCLLHQTMSGGGERGGGAGATLVLASCAASSFQTRNIVVCVPIFVGPLVHLHSQGHCANFFSSSLFFCCRLAKRPVVAQVLRPIRGGRGLRNREFRLDRKHSLCIGQAPRALCAGAHQSGRYPWYSCLFPIWIGPCVCLAIQGHVRS